MIGSTIEQVSKAGSRIVYLLAFFLAVSVVYGLYFVQGWFFFALAIAIYKLKSLWKIYNSSKGLSVPVGITDGLFLMMIFFSALGLIYPVRVKDGLVEIMRWGILWFIFRLSTTISKNELARECLVQRIGIIGSVVALVGCFPWGRIDGRLSSLFGYSNATAAFLGAVLLLHPSQKVVRAFLGISLVLTGSRAGVGLFSLLYFSRQSLYWIERRHVSIKSQIRRGKKVAFFKRIREKKRVIGLGILGFALMAIWFKPAWENLTTWGFSSISWLERLNYYRDGIKMARNFYGFPRAGGWMAFPTVQTIPYWTADPHSSFIHILLNQGIYGIVCLGIWISITFRGYWESFQKKIRSPESAIESQKPSFEERGWSALIFLLLHSLIDADLSFGALGFLFWMLFGSIGSNSSEVYRLTLKRNTFSLKLLSQGIMIMYLFIGLAAGYTLIRPSILDKEKTWNKLALSEQDPEKSMTFWELSLNWDHTQIKVLRTQAELFLRHGNTDAGLKRVEEVLYWQPLDLQAYEWAQSLVWETAEKTRALGLENPNKLYQWVEGVPQRIEERVARVNEIDRDLWRSRTEFRPSQHIKLLAEYAHQRQFTQLPAKT